MVDVKSVHLHYEESYHVMVFASASHLHLQAFPTQHPMV
jgi:hypothetical protein